MAVAATYASYQYGTSLMGRVDAPVAISSVVISMDLLAFALLTQTLSDWFAHCQKMMDRRDGLGMSMPAHILRVRSALRALSS